MGARAPLEVLFRAAFVYKNSFFTPRTPLLRKENDVTKVVWQIIQYTASHPHLIESNLRLIAQKKAFNIPIDPNFALIRGNDYP